MNWEPGKTRTLTADQKRDWDGRLDRGAAKAKTFHVGWDRYLSEYAKPRYEKDNYDVDALLPYRHVERKKAALFTGTPEIQLAPIDPQDQRIPYDQILPQRQKYLNDKLGPNATKAKHAVHKALVDAMAASGWLVTKIGYENRTATVEVQQPVMFNPLAPPETVKVKVPVWERCFVSYVSGKKLIVPDEWADTDFDEAPFLAVKGTMAVSQARGMGWAIPKEFTATATRDEAMYDYGDQQESGGGDPLVEYTEVWYRAAFYDEGIPNPDLYRNLIVVKGIDTPVKHVDSPYQAVDQLGRLTPDSMVGNPIHVGTLRDLPDSAYVPCDLAVGEQLKRELNKYRTSLVQNRVARSPITVIDPEGFTPETLVKIDNGDKVVYCKPGGLLGGQEVIKTFQVGQEPRDNFAAQDQIERDWQSALGSGDNQSGQIAKTKRTATEIRTTQGNASARDEVEKTRAREYFVALVSKLDALLQRYATRDDLLKVLGPTGAQVWESWRQLPGRYSYSILPDSGVYLDVQQMRAQALDDYNLLRKDPLIDPVKLLKRTVQKLGHQADMVGESVPESGPEPLKTNMSFKGEDLIGMQSQAVVEILAQMGITISPMAIQALKAAQMVQAQAGAPITPSGAPQAPAPHGGSADRTEPINQHQTERTGAVQGVGA